MNDYGTLTTKCFNQIEAWILQGKLLPGTKLKGEELKEKLNVGLSPIREALSKLTAIGLVEFKNKIGFKVATLSEDQVVDTIRTFAKIECLVLKEAIENGDDEWEAVIVGTLHKLGKVETTNASVSYDLWEPRNTDFHNALIASCKVKGLLQTRNQWEQLNQWIIRLSYNLSSETAIMACHKEHQDIARAVLNRNIDDACSLMYTHVIGNIKDVVPKLRADGLIK